MERAEELVKQFAEGSIGLPTFHRGIREESGELADRSLMLLTHYENSDLDLSALRQQVSDLIQS